MEGYGVRNPRAGTRELGQIWRSLERSQELAGAGYESARRRGQRGWPDEYRLRTQIAHKSAREVLIAHRTSAAS